MLRTEVTVVSNLFREVEDLPSNLVRFLQFVHPFMRCIRIITQLSGHCMYLPCTTAANERSFSLMDRVNNNLRSTKSTIDLVDWEFLA